MVSNFSSEAKACPKSTLHMSLISKSFLPKYDAYIVQSVHTSISLLPKKKKHTSLSPFCSDLELNEPRGTFFFFEQSLEELGDIVSKGQRDRTTVSDSAN